MVELLIRYPHERDVLDLAAHLRLGDRAELASCNLFDPLAVIRQGVRDSKLCWAARDAGDDTMLAIFGVAPLRPHLLLEDTGVPWLLATDAMTRATRDLATGHPPYIDQMLATYPRLLNFVHAENRRAVRWLRHIGFTLSPAAPFGPNGALFHQFSMQRHV